MSTDLDALVARLRDIEQYVVNGHISTALTDAADAVASLRAQVAAHHDMLRRVHAEFGDYHYEDCPADLATGEGCKCFAGALMADVWSALQETGK